MYILRLQDFLNGLKITPIQFDLNLKMLRMTAVISEGEVALTEAVSFATIATLRPRLIHPRMWVYHISAMSHRGGMHGTR